MSNAGAGERRADAAGRSQAEVDELRGSRRRLVMAADADRRELERALHDGLQQTLVALAADLRRAAALVEGDPVAAKTVLGEMGVTVRQAMDDASQLAHAIHPPLLAARGLASALRSAAASAGISVSITVPAGGSQDVESAEAVYWCCIEALSSAPVGTHATVSVGEADAGLSFEVTVAGAYPEARLERLRDRVDALGGRVTVGAIVDGGSRVAGWLPLAG